jgi:hypothetical protein
MCAVHEFEANFRGSMSHFKVTSVVGHVYKYACYLQIPSFLAPILLLNIKRGKQLIQQPYLQLLL